MIKNSQSNNPRCSTRDENSQPSQPFSPRAATAFQYQRNQTGSVLHHVAINVRNLVYILILKSLLVKQKMKFLIQFFLNLGYYCMASDPELL